MYLHVPAQHEPRLHGQSDTVGVQHGQRTGQRHVEGRDRHIRREGRGSLKGPDMIGIMIDRMMRGGRGRGRGRRESRTRGGREEFVGGEELNVHFEANHGDDGVGVGVGVGVGRDFGRFGGGGGGGRRPSGRDSEGPAKVAWGSDPGGDQKPDGEKTHTGIM